MGFDLYGVNPKEKPDEIDFITATEDEIKAYFIAQKKDGVYFRNNVWWWHPLWNLIGELCSDILTEKDIKAGGWNDGHLINKSKAVRIGQRLNKLLESGEVEKEIDKYLINRGEYDKDECKTWYDINKDNVKDFAHFAIHSGGFEIC